MAHIPKYEKVKTLILADIRDGVYQTGERIPTREQLVKKYSVTRTTIGQALKILVSAGVLATSKRGGTIVTGKRMPLSIALISTMKELDTVGILNTGETESLGIFKPLLEVASEFKLNFIDIRSLSPDDLPWCSKYDYTIWVMPNDDILEKLPEHKDNVLVINRYHKELNFITTNHRQVVREMTEYNLERAGKQCQKFFLNDISMKKNFVYRERRKGFIDACQNANVSYQIHDLSELDYERILKSLMNIEFDKNKNVLIVSPCLSYTGAVLQMAHRRGLEFGKSLFYSDFDNRYSLRNTGIKIVSAIQNYDMIGHELVEALRKFGKKKIQIFVPCKITK